MTGGTTTSTNTQLNNKETALPIIQAASNALDALRRAGVVLNPVEVAFAEALPWDKLKAELLAAYDQGKTPQVEIAEGLPGVGKGVPSGDKVLIKLIGVVRPGGL